RVQLRAGTNVIGDQVIYLSSGTTKQRQLADGDTLHNAEQTDMEGLASDAAVASKQFPAILANVKLLASQLKSAQSTLGAFGADTRATRMNVVMERASNIMERASNPHGTIGLALENRGRLQARAAQAMARVDSIRSLLG